MSVNQTLLSRLETNDRSLENVGIGSTRDFREFITAIPENSNLRRISINGVVMDPDVATAFSTILPRMPFLVSSMMNNCDCSNADGLSILASALASRDLQDFLWLRCCRIGNRGAEIIASSLRGTDTLKKLYLERNSIGDLGAIALASLFSGNSSIRNVYLRDNNTGADGMSALAASIGKNRSIKLIQLQGNADKPNTDFNRALYNDASIESVISSNHTILFIEPPNIDLLPLLYLNRAGPEKSMRAKIVRFLNEQPTFVLTMDFEGNLMPSYMEKIGRDCQLNTMFELIHNIPGLFDRY